MAIHAKFSIPTACLVFAVIALALGLRVSRDGKLGGFVVGIGVIFTYYILMFLAESMAKGGQIPAAWARWVPNLVLGPFGIVALVWRAGHAEGRLPFGLRLPPFRVPAWARRRAKPPANASAPARPPPTRRRAPGVVLVVRVPRLHAPMPSLIDRYISRLYVRVAGLSFLALLGLFYISTFIDRSDKVFKGQATTAMIGAAAGAPHAAVHLLRDPDRGAAERARDLRAAGAKQRADGHEGLRHQPLPHRALGRGAVALLQRRALFPRAAADGKREPAGRGPRRAESADGSREP